MILNRIYISRGLYIFNQVKSKPMWLLSALSATDLYTRRFCHLVNALTLTNCGIEQS